LAGADGNDCSDSNNLVSVNDIANSLKINVINFNAIENEEAIGGENSRRLDSLTKEDSWSLGFEISNNNDSYYKSRGLFRKKK